MQVFWLFCTKSLMTVSQSMGSSKSRRAEDDSWSLYGYLRTSLSARVFHLVVVFSRKSWLAYQVLFCAVALLGAGATTTTTEKAIDLGSKTKNSQSAWYLAEFLCSHCTTKLTWQPWPEWQCDHLWSLLNISDRRSVKVVRFCRKYLYRDSSVSIVAPCEGIQDSPGFWIPCRGFRIPGTGIQFLIVELGFWIPVVSVIPESMSCIPDSKAQDSGSRKQKILGFRNPDSVGLIVDFFHPTVLNDFWLCKRLSQL